MELLLKGLCVFLGRTCDYGFENVWRLAFFKVATVFLSTAPFWRRISFEEHWGYSSNHLRLGHRRNNKTIYLGQFICQLVLEWFIRENKHFTSYFICRLGADDKVNYKCFTRVGWGTLANIWWQQWSFNTANILHLNHSNFTVIKTSVIPIFYFIKHFRIVLWILLMIFKILLSQKKFFRIIGYVEACIYVILEELYPVIFF